MKLVALLLGSALLLAGCSSILGEQNDAAACQELSAVVSPDSLSLDSLNPETIAETLRQDILPLAGVGLATRIEALAKELEKPQIDSAAAAALASEIAVRCAITGVNFDFSILGEILN